MNISLMQAVIDDIIDLLVSQNGTKAIGLLFWLQKIWIGAEFVPFLVGQGVCIKGRKISEQEFVHCQPICWRIILYWTIYLSLNFVGFKQCRNSWLI